MPIRPFSGSTTSPVPDSTSDERTSATAISACSWRKYLSVRQSLASSTQARARLPGCCSILASSRSDRAKASAVAPAKPTSTSPPLPMRRTLRALDFITVAPAVTWPSPATTTRPPLRTDRIVVERHLSLAVMGNHLCSGREPQRVPAHAEYRVFNEPRRRPVGGATGPCRAHHL